MSTQAAQIAGALLTDVNFATLVATLKEKRDAVASFQQAITSYTAQIANFNSLLTAAQAEEADVATRVQTACATIIAANLQ